MYIHETKMIIEGPFINYKPDSSGNFKVRYPNGEVYEGSMSNLKRNGKGKNYYINGDWYEGDWLSNKRVG